MKNVTYAIGDIHGEIFLLDKAMQYIDNDAKEADTVKVVILGDMIDRGAFSKEVLLSLRELTEKYPDEFVCLKGNHEDMWVDDTKVGIWLANGGDALIGSFDNDEKELYVDLRNWARGLATIYQDEHRIFVHAAYEDPRVLPDKIDYHRLWFRYGKGENVKDFIEGFDKFVVHGHTPHKNVIRMEDRINLDVGSCFYNQLAVAKFDNDVAGGPVHVEMIYGDGHAKAKKVLEDS